MERHRMPAMRAVGTGREARALGAVVRFRRLDRAARLRIDAGRPRHGGERLRRDELAGRAIDHVEEAVLRRLHQHLAHRAVDAQIGQHDRLRARVVPVVGGRLLEVPDVFTGGRANREDRAQIQVVSAAGTAQFARPGRAVAGADVEEIEGGVVGHAVPWRAATAVFPPGAVPGRGGLAHRVVFERQARIAGDGPEPPHFLAGLGVVRRDESADAELRSARAGDHPSLDDARRARDAVVIRLARHLPRPERAAAVARRARRGGCRACRRTPCRCRRRRRD